VIPDENFDTHPTLAYSQLPFKEIYGPMRDLK
jgi:hypothetical protein